MMTQEKSTVQRNDVTLADLKKILVKSVCDEISNLETIAEDLKAHFNSDYRVHNVEEKTIYIMDINNITLHICDKSFSLEMYKINENDVISFNKFKTDIVQIFQTVIKHNPDIVFEKISLSKTITKSVDIFNDLFKYFEDSVFPKPVIESDNMRNEYIEELYIDDVPTKIERNLYSSKLPLKDGTYKSIYLGCLNITVYSIDVDIDNIFEKIDNLNDILFNVIKECLNINSLK